MSNAEELIIAFVSPIGTPLDMVQDALYAALESHGYSLGIHVRISRLLDQSEQLADDLKPHERQEQLMNAGNRAREKHGEDHLALLAVTAINGNRIRDTSGVRPNKRVAHVVRSLKSPNEVSVLREIYGVGFFLIGVSAPRAVRLQNLIDRNFPKDEANRLLDKDADEEAASGQKTRDTFELADAFIHMGSNGDGAKDKIFRIVDLLMSCPYHPPTLEEHAMFMAYAAAIRSGDLSRQVGAVVTNRRGDVIASGANDAPAKGASHWPVDLNFVEEPEPGAGPDYLRGYDSNERERNKILAAVIEALVPSEATGRVPNSEERRAKRAGQEVQGPPAIVWHSRSHRVRAGGPRRNGGADVIIAAGISKVIYIEPYPKSKAKQLYDDSICLPDDADWGDARREDDKYVLFVPFEGVGPRRFIDLFSLSLGSGRTIIRKKRDADGARIEWRRGRDSAPRLPLDPRSYLEREDAGAKVTRQRLQGYDME